MKELEKAISYKWKIQSFNKAGTKAQCVAYIDARDVMDILDEVIGGYNWQDSYEFVGDKLICGIGIRHPEDAWVWKYDTGVEADFEKEKSQFSDAFKRAAVKWGIGRFLYDLDIKWVDVKDRKPIDSNGNIIWDLTKHFNGTEQKPVTKTVSKTPVKKETPKEEENILDIFDETVEVGDEEHNVTKSKPAFKVGEKLICGCGREITPVVESFSVKKYGEPLCMVCQTKVSKEGK